MPLAAYYVNGALVRQRIMKVPKRVELLEKWWQNAVRAIPELQSEMPVSSGLPSGAATEVEVLYIWIRWTIGESSYEVRIDRKRQLL